MGTIASTFEQPRATIPAPPLRRTVFVVIFGLLWFREYWDIGFNLDPSFLYDRAIGSVRWMDLIIGFIVLTHLWLWRSTNRRWVGIPREIKRPAIAFVFAIAFAIINGARQGGHNFAYDWRGIALGVGIGFAVTYWIRTPEHLMTALRTFAVVFGIRVAEILVEWLGGGGARNVIPGMRTPFFDGPPLSTAAFLALLGLKMYTADRSPLWRKAWACVAVMCYLFVLLCMRRTFWAELLLGSAILVLASEKYRLKLITFTTVVILTVLTFSGKTLDERIKSVNPLDTDPVYASTNTGHIFDVLDALVHVREHPIMGIGLGMPYETFRITEWKTESYMVHNAIVHVWLFYGLFGLVVYLYYHFSLFRWLRRFRLSTDRRVAAAGGAALAYLAAQFAVTWGFTPWPYSQTQEDIVIFFLIAALVCVRYTIPGETSASSETGAPQ